MRWLADLCGLPARSGGLLLSGGSVANLTALVAARLAGIPAAGVRVVGCTAELRMDAAAAAEMIAADRAAGRRPFLLVGSAGTTNTGAIDPLPELAELARREGLWLHVDAAYGGMFRLTGRGRERLRGTELADSVTLDPHKTLFLPYGTAALVVRDPARLAAAHEAGGHYLQDLAASDEIPDYAHLGPELTRDVRGLWVWLPLHLYGVAAFRAALDEKLDLAELAYTKLSAEPLLEVPWLPELSTVAFRMRRSNAATRRLADRINAGRRIFLSSTVIGGRHTLRLCIVSHRTHADRITEAIDIITAAAQEV